MLKSIFGKSFKYLCLAFLLLLILASSYTPSMLNGDVSYYIVYGTELVQGKNIISEYPSGAVLYFALPKLLTSSINQYTFVFGLFNIFLALLLLYYSRKLASVIGLKDDLYLLFVLFMATFSFYILLRFDILPTLLVVSGLYYYLKNKKYGLIISVALMTFGGFVKLVPFLILPLIFLNEFKKGNLKRIVQFILTFIITSIPFIILFLSNNIWLPHFLGYHSERGFEIGSIIGDTVIILNRLGVVKTAQVIFNFGSVNTVFDASPTLEKYTSALFIVCFTFLLYKFYKSRKQKNEGKRLVYYSTILIMIFIISNKVLSPQYILWTLPLVIICSGFLEGRVRDILRLSFFLVCFLSILFYPLQAGGTTQVIILFLRNVFLLITFLILVFKAKEFQ